METQQSNDSNPKKGMNKVWLVAGLVLIVCCCLALIAAGVGGILFYRSSAPPQATTSSSAPRSEALITADELNSLSEPVGIIQWELVEATPGEHRVCNTFQGVSWSVTPNQGTNCIYSISPGSTMVDITQSFLDSGQLFPDEKPIPSGLSIEYDNVLYAGTHPNAHTVYDLFVVKDGLLYWSSVTVGTPAGAGPEEIYQSYEGTLGNLLYEIIKINMSRSE